MHIGSPDKMLHMNDMPRNKDITVVERSPLSAVTLSSPCPTFPSIKPSHQNAKNGENPLIDVTTPHHPRTPAGAGDARNSGMLGTANSTGNRLGSKLKVGGGGVEGMGSSSNSSRVFNPVSSAEPYFRPFNVTPSSASQFVLAEASRGSPSPHLVHQSPVLNTEELYRAAGWMTPLPKRAGGMGDGDSDDDDDFAGTSSAERGAAGSNSRRLAVLSTKNGQHDTSQRMAHSLALSDANSGGGDGGGATAAVAAATAAGISASEAEAAADAGARTADRIRDEIAREPVLSLANLAGFDGEPGGARDAREGRGGSDGGGGSSSGEAGVDPGDEDGVEDPGIPKSIAEIYEVGLLGLSHYMSSPLGLELVKSCRMCGCVLE